MAKIKLSKKKKQQQDHETIAGTPWEHSSDFIIAVWEKYVEGKISARRLMETFPGRTFKAIEDKVYHIRGRGEHVQFKDPNQCELPLGGELDAGTNNSED